ncbi:hypothetical protein [Natronococcus occultus]|uniref:hypothetical protein n=1 Tax=Natronococcus occultus TaxID=29288 RepID=UPI000677EE06|nr:hypothetical protein [Natronococcus occultus]
MGKSTICESISVAVTLAPVDRIDLGAFLEDVDDRHGGDTATSGDAESPFADGENDHEATCI